MSYIRPTATGSYTWKLPALSTRDAIYVCSGYIRIEFEAMYHIPKDIVSVCTDYFNTYDNILKELKRGELKAFSSNIFQLDSIRFYMQFETGKYDTMTWRVYVPCFPQNIVKITLDAFLEIIGTRFNHKKHYILDESSMSMYYYDTNLIANIQNFDELQLKLTIFDMKQYDKNDNIIPPRNPYQLMTDTLYPSSGFIWRITDKLTMEQLHKASAGINIPSPLFLCESFKWMIKISYYDMVDADLCVYLASLSPKIKQLCIAYKLFVEETDKLIEGTQVFSDNRMSLWRIDFFKSEEIKNLKHVTLKMEISILDIFYVDDYQTNNDNVGPQNQTLKTINGQYLWTIDEEEAVKKIKTAENGTDFISPFFEISKFKFCMKSYPNGYSNDNLGKMNTFLRLASFPTNVGLIAIEYELGLIQTNTKFTAVERFSNDSPSFGWTANLLQTSKIENAEKLTFKTVIKIVDVFDDKGNNITDQFIDDENDEYDDSIRDMMICKNYKESPSVYEWRITDLETIDKIKKAKNGANFLSPIFNLFGMRWYLEFMPVPCDRDPEFDHEGKDEKMDYSVLYFCAASISPNIAEIRMNYALRLKETDTVYRNCTELDGCYSTGWSRDTLKRKEIDELDTFTFSVGIDFIDIHDKKGKNLTDQYVVYNYNNDEEKKDIELPSLMTDTFEWKVDGELMEKVKNAKNADFFMSDMFIMHGFKWKMKIYPKGTKPQRMGIFNWYFNLISIPPNVSKVAVFYKIVEKETGVMDLDKTSMRSSSSQFGWGQNKLKLKDVMERDRLCFALDIKIIDIFDNNGNRFDVDDYNKIPLKLDQGEEKKLNELEWKIEDDAILKKMKGAKVGEIFQSGCYEMEGFKWFLRLVPNGMNKEEKGDTKLFICIESLPEDILNISFYFEMYILETGLSYCNYAHFRDDLLSKSWLTSQMKIEQLQDLSHLTLQTKMRIVDIYTK